MKIKRKIVSRKKILLIIIITLLVVCVGVAYIIKLTNDRNNEVSEVNNNPATKDQSQDGLSKKEDSVESSSVPDNPKTDADDTHSPSTQPGEKTAVSVNITALSQAGSTLQVRSLIETITSTGTCTLTLTKDNKTVTKTAAVQPLANASTCQGFDIPTSELSAGTWNINLLFESETHKGTDIKTVDIS